MKQSEEICRILTEVIKGLCKNKDAVNVRMAEMSKSITYSITVDGEDQGKVVGARGANITAIKSVFGSATCEGKSLSIFLGTAEGFGKPEKFSTNPNWSVLPYVELLDDWVAMFVDARCEGQDLGAVSVIECELFEELDSKITEDMSSIISAIAKCNGGTINVNFVGG